MLMRADSAAFFAAGHNAKISICGHAGNSRGRPSDFIFDAQPAHLAGMKSVQRSWNPCPADPRFKRPAAEVIWQPSPSLRADPRPAESAVETPAAIRKWRPARRDAVWLPAHRSERTRNPVAVAREVLHSV